MSSGESRPGQAIGQVLRRLRQERGYSQDMLARHLASKGLRWSIDQVSSVESGAREDLTISELALLSHALGVRLADWLEGSGAVRLSPIATAPMGSLRAWASGGRPPQVAVGPLGGQAAADYMDILMYGQLPAESEKHAARKLGVAPHQVREASLLLWDRSLDQERERRLQQQGRPPTTAHRGRVSRELLAELPAGLQRLAEQQVESFRQGGEVARKARKECGER